jgi:hypothetical protein
LHHTKAPQKKLQQNSSKQATAWKQNGPEKPLYTMGREHILGCCLNTARIPFILFQRVEVNQMPTGPIHKKAEKLLENLGDLLPLSASSYFTEKLLQVWIQLNAPQISYKQGQSRTTAKNITGHIYVVNYWLAITFLCATIFHNDLLPIGFCLRIFLFVLFAFIPQTYRWGEVFFEKNRSSQEKIRKRWTRTPIWRRTILDFNKNSGG